jgi:Sulfatase-modifying factor enzyme 1
VTFTLAPFLCSDKFVLAIFVEKTGFAGYNDYVTYEGQSVLATEVEMPKKLCTFLKNMPRHTLRIVRESIKEALAAGLCVLTGWLWLFARPSPQPLSNALAPPSPKQQFSSGPTTKTQPGADLSADFTRSTPDSPGQESLARCEGVYLEKLTNIPFCLISIDGGKHTFYIAQHVMTWREWTNMVSQGTQILKSDLPVVNIPAPEIIQNIAKYGFRIPTDAEWRAALYYSPSDFYAASQTATSSSATFSFGPASALSQPLNQLGLAGGVGNVSEVTMKPSTSQFVLFGGNWSSTSLLSPGLRTEGIILTSPDQTNSPTVGYRLVVDNVDHSFINVGSAFQ